MCCAMRPRQQGVGSVGLSMWGLGVPHGSKCACVCDSPSAPQLSSLKQAQYLSMRSARLSPFHSAESMTAGATPRSSAVIALPLLSRRLMLRPVREARGYLCLPWDPGTPQLARGRIGSAKLQRRRSLRVQRVRERGALLSMKEDPSATETLHPLAIPRPWISSPGSRVALPPARTG